MLNSYTCIIIDDEEKAVALLSKCLSYLFPDLKVIHTFTLWSDALPVLRSEPCDILFTDISMPGKTGLDLLALLPELDSEIVIVSAHAEYALKSMKFAPSGYILKPIEDDQLTEAVSKAIERVKHKRAARSQPATATTTAGKIGVPNARGTDIISTDDIILLESVNNCTRIVTKDSEIMSSYTMSRYKALVTPYNFLQVHRSFIVNLNAIRRFTHDGTIMMNNGMEVPVSRSYKDDFWLNFERVTKTD